MATKQDCINAAMAGGLSRQEAQAAVDALLENKARVNRARAEGQVVNAEAEMAKAWAVTMDDAKAAAAVARKQAAINVLRRQAIEERFAAIKAEGFTGMDALEALLVGSGKRFTGARNSIDATRLALKRDFLGSLFNDLERLDTGGAPVLKLFNDQEFGASVIREIIDSGQGAHGATRANAKGETALSPGERERVKGSDIDITARNVAGIMSRHMEKARQRMNAAGASIGKLDGYIPQSHDAWKLTAKRDDGKSARQGWVESVRDKLDLERSFGLDAETAASPAGAARITEILNDVYDNITLGRDMITAAEKGQRTGPASLANKLARHRVLHFKDADAYMAYHAEYGKGGALTGVLTHLDTAARSTALLEALGTNPETMLKSIIAQETRSLRDASSGSHRAQVEDHKSPLPSPGASPSSPDGGLASPESARAQMRALDELRNAEGLRDGKVANWWRELTGEANWPANTGAARIGAVLRATQSLGKLGGASLSAVADVFVKAMNMRVHGVNWPESVVRALGQYFESYKGDKRQLARQLGAFVDDVGAEMRLRWDMSETLPGKLAAVQDKFFKWSGLNWITENGKAGFATWFSSHLGEITGKSWAEIDAPRKATLEHHGVTAERWELMRLMTETAPDGRTMLVPQRAEAIPEAVLREHLAERIAEIEKAAQGDMAVIDPAVSRLLDTTRDGLRTDVMSMIADETKFAIIEPDAKTNAFMRQGTRPGTMAGELWRFAMQFKSFPIAYLQREMGGRRWKRADLAASGKYDLNGAIGAAIAAFTFGYIAMTLKDMAKGRTPKQLWDESGVKKETIFAALMQSGGAGILGDFFLNKSDRFGNSFAGTLAGPLLGEAGHLVSAVSLGIRGQVGDGAARQTPGNAAHRTPVAQTLPFNRIGERMTTRNSNGLYDAPDFQAERGPLVLTHEQLAMQMEDSAFAMDRDEALKCGLINPYDDDTAKVMVR